MDLTAALPARHPSPIVGKCPRTEEVAASLKEAAEIVPLAR